MTVPPSTSSPSTAHPVNRRTALRLLGAAAVGGVTLSVAAGIAPVPALGAAPAGKPRWFGHQPGKVYLGVSMPEDIATAEQVTGQLGVQRTFFDWNDGDREDRTVAADHAAGRLPWISFKPASSSPGGWAAIACGEHDQALRARARRYAAYRKCTLLTFHHEPTNDNTGTGAEWAAAYLHSRAIIRDEIGRSNIRFVPIIGDWAFNPRNGDANAGEFLTPDVLDHCAFVGVDCYQNASLEGFDNRLGRIVEFLDRQGFPKKMLGIGETGSTDYYGVPGAAEWWTRQWTWIENNTDRVGVVSYFNSGRNSRDGVYWPLDESTQKMSRFRDSNQSLTSTRLA
ncbi:MAG: hypothetical protein M3419_01165 [Actinomycetota bacterium]|nr:hypothetical protein [Actinomycetota bacterium]